MSIGDTGPRHRIIVNPPRQYADGVTIITCTGDRPEAFDLCRKFVERQTYVDPQGRNRKLQWIRVKDGKDNGCSPGSHVVSVFGTDRDNPSLMDVRLPPKPGQNTLARNLLEAIPQVEYNKVLFFEDDDFYAPDYVAKMAALLDGGCSIVGDPNSLYYHLPSRKYRVMKNGASASLCQTGIRAELLPLLQRVCEAGPEFIDYRLWQGAPTKLLTHVGGVVGIKGLPGRPGIGVGHYPEKQAQCWSDDTDLSVLRKWIGDDVSMYQEWL